MNIGGNEPIGDIPDSVIDAGAIIGVGISVGAAVAVEVGLGKGEDVLEGEVVAITPGLP